MPKLSALPASAAGGAAVDKLFASNRASSPKNADRDRTFDDLLSGARRKPEPAPPRTNSDRDESARASGRASKTKLKPSKKDAAQRKSDPADDANYGANDESARAGEPSETKPSDTSEAESSGDTATRKAEKAREKKADGADGRDEVDLADEAQLAGASQVADPNADTVVIPSPDELANAEDAVAIEPGENASNGVAAAAAEPKASADPSQAAGELLAGVLNGAAAQRSSNARQSTSDSAETKSGAKSSQTKPITPPVLRAAPQEPGEVKLRPPAKNAGANALSVAANAATAVEAIDPDADPSSDALADAAAAAPVGHDHSAEQLLENFASQHANAPTAPAAGSLASNGATSQQAPEARFADDNHPAIVAGVRGQLMPSGGTMHIRLDPPELGPLAVTVRLRDGVMEASFETSNDEAAKLLSHSLGTLKSSLESQGVNVERLHVQQAPKNDPSNQSGNDRDGQQGQDRNSPQDNAARQDHQRREMLRRMWRKLTGVEDPLDLVG